MSTINPVFADITALDILNFDEMIWGGASGSIPKRRVRAAGTTHFKQIISDGQYRERVCGTTELKTSGIYQFFLVF